LGRVTEELGFYSLEVQRMELWPRIPDPRFADASHHLSQPETHPPTLSAESPTDELYETTARIS